MAELFVGEAFWSSAAGAAAKDAATKISAAETRLIPSSLFAHSIAVAERPVFIDPVTTGYSRPAPGEKPERFHGVRWARITLSTARGAHDTSHRHAAPEAHRARRARQQEAGSARVGALQP